MKVSQEKKQQTRRLLIKTAIELFSEKGIDQTTMKQIARTAGVGDATIYKYFANKEKLLIGFYELVVEDSLNEIEEIADFSEYSLQEKLQVLVDTYLEKLLPEREFVEHSLAVFFKTPLSIMTDTIPGQKKLRAAMATYITQAEENNEIPPLPLKNGIINLLGDYLFGVAFFWIKDDSEEFSNTTQLVDLSLGVVVLMLKSGMLNKIIELAGFLLKTQLYRLMENSGGLISLLQMTKNTMSATMQNSQKSEQE